MMPNIEQQQQTKPTIIPNIERIIVGFCLFLLLNILYFSWILFVAAVQYLVS
jgi:hypothetical protein